MRAEVTRISFKNTYTTTFDVIFERSIYHVLHNMFVPIEMGDTIVFRNPSISGNNITITTMPMICIDICSNMRRLMFLAMKFSKIISKNLSRLVFLRTDDKNMDSVLEEEVLYKIVIRNNVDEFISWMMETSIEGECASECDVSHAFVETFMRLWKSKHIDRSLYAMGLRKEEIEKSMLDKFELKYIVKSNPFILSHLEVGRCVEIAKTIGFDIEDCYILGHAICKDITDKSKGGSCLSVPVGYIKSLNGNDSEDLIEFMKKIFKVVILEGMIYTNIAYMIELKVFNFLKCMRGNSKKINMTDTGMILSDEQRSAFEDVHNHHLVCISGCAGSGKSTLIKEIYKSLKKSGSSVVLASFTGKAVSRLKDLLIQDPNFDGDDIQAYTLDKMERIGNIRFDSLIIDEASMVSTELFYRFIKVYGHLFRLVLVGDNNQLQPIGQGSFFDDVYNSCIGKIHMLRQNHRIQTFGTLRENIHSLITTTPTMNQGDDFHIIQTDPGDEMEVVRQLVIHLKSLGIAHDDLKVLSFFTEYIERLNDIVKDIYFSNKGNMPRDSCVIATKNDYTIDVMNGEEGRVMERRGDHILVDFYGNICEIEPDNIVSSYATTVHKSQGSEYYSVILFLPYRKTDPGKFLSMNLLYTSLSRARHAVYIIGNTTYLSTSCSNVKSVGAGSLCRRLREFFEIEEEAPKGFVCSGGFDDFEGDDGFDSDYD